MNASMREHKIFLFLIFVLNLLPCLRTQCCMRLQNQTCMQCPVGMHLFRHNCIFDLPHCNNYSGGFDCAQCQPGYQIVTIDNDRTICQAVDDSTAINGLARKFVELTEEQLYGDIVTGITMLTYDSMARKANQINLETVFKSATENNQTYYRMFFTTENGFLSLLYLLKKPVTSSTQVGIEQIVVAEVNQTYFNYYSEQNKKILIKMSQYIRKNYSGFAGLQLLGGFKPMTNIKNSSNIVKAVLIDGNFGLRVVSIQGIIDKTTENNGKISADFINDPEYASMNQSVQVNISGLNDSMKAILNAVIESQGLNQILNASLTQLKKLSQPDGTTRYFATYTDQSPQNQTLISYLIFSLPIETQAPIPYKIRSFPDKLPNPTALPPVDANASKLQNILAQIRVVPLCVDMTSYTSLQSLPNITLVEQFNYYNTAWPIKSAIKTLIECMAPGRVIVGSDVLRSSIGYNQTHVIVSVLFQIYAMVPSLHHFMFSANLSNAPDNFLIMLWHRTTPSLSSVDLYYNLVDGRVEDRLLDRFGQIADRLYTRMIVPELQSYGNYTLVKFSMRNYSEFVASTNSTTERLQYIYKVHLQKPIPGNPSYEFIEFTYQKSGELINILPQTVYPTQPYKPIIAADDTLFLLITNMLTMPIEAAGKQNEITVDRTVLVLASEYRQGYVMAVAEVVWNHNKNNNNHNTNNNNNNNNSDSSDNSKVVKFVTFVLNTESSDELFVLNMSDTDPSPSMGGHQNNNTNNNTNNTNSSEAYSQCQPFPQCTSQLNQPSFFINQAVITNNTTLSRLVQFIDMQFGATQMGYQLLYLRTINNNTNTNTTSNSTDLYEVVFWKTNTHDGLQIKVEYSYGINYQVFITGQREVKIGTQLINTLQHTNTNNSISNNNSSNNSNNSNSSSSNDRYEQLVGQYKLQVDAFESIANVSVNQASVIVHTSPTLIGFTLTNGLTYNFSISNSNNNNSSNNNSILPFIIYTPKSSPAYLSPALLQQIGSVLPQFLSMNITDIQVSDTVYHQNYFNIYQKYGVVVSFIDGLGDPQTGMFEFTADKSQHTTNSINRQSVRVVSTGVLFGTIPPSTATGNADGDTPSMPMVVDLLEQAKANNITSISSNTNANANTNTNANSNANDVGNSRPLIFTVNPNINDYPSTNMDIRATSTPTSTYINSNTNTITNTNSIVPNIAAIASDTLPPIPTRTTTTTRSNDNNNNNNNNNNNSILSTDLPITIWPIKYTLTQKSPTSHKNTANQHLSIFGNKSILSIRPFRSTTDPSIKHFVSEDTIQYIVLDNSKYGHVGMYVSNDNSTIYMAQLILRNQTSEYIQRVEAQTREWLTQLIAKLSPIAQNNISKDIKLNLLLATMANITANIHEHTLLYKMDDDDTLVNLTVLSSSPEAKISIVGLTAVPNGLVQLKEDSQYSYLFIHQIRATDAIFRTVQQNLMKLYGFYLIGARVVYFTEDIIGTSRHYVVKYQTQSGGIYQARISYSQPTKQSRVESLTISTSPIISTRSCIKYAQQSSPSSSSLSSYQSCLECSYQFSLHSDGTCLPKISNCEVQSAKICLQCKIDYIMSKDKLSCL